MADFTTALDCWVVVCLFLIGCNCIIIEYLKCNLQGRTKIVKVTGGKIKLV